MYTDEKILEALAQDPEEGAKLLVEKYFSIIRSTCAKKLKNKEDIQECVNDVFAEFCLNYTQYDNGKSNLKNYLCTIAKRRAIDRYRQNCRNEKLEEEIQKRYKDDLTDKENQAKNIEQLEEALVQLEPLDQQIIKKHYYEGQTYGEIAKELDMNYENVKKRGFRGKKKLLYLILIGLLIIGITACTTVVMKKYNLLPEWFPFYDWIFPDGPDGEESNKNGVEEKLKISIDTERNQETEEEAEGIKETDTEEVTVSTEKDTEGTTKKYQFSSQSGFRWSDKPTYELVKTEQYYEKDEIRYEISEACYQEGKITVTFYVKWLNPVDMKEFTFDSAQDWVTYDMYVDEKWHKAAAAVLDTAYILLENGETVEFLDQRTG
ncbi:MAG: RNA polymerase sigma factor, partial [Dorea sp.]